MQESPGLEVRAGLWPRPLRVLDLGVIPYREAWDLQNRVVEGVGSGSEPETLFLLEHPHTYTCGRSGGRDHILVDDAQLARLEVEVLDVDRGGDITYHGPGQLVAYPIINLRKDAESVDYPGYVRALEKVLMSTVAQFDVRGEQLKGYSGVWVAGPRGLEKIAAIGVKVDGRGISSHGIALNVTTDLAFFGRIIPCGITDKGVTSLAAQMPGPPSMDEVKRQFAGEFATTFGFQHEDASAAGLLP